MLLATPLFASTAGAAIVMDRVDAASSFKYVLVGDEIVDSDHDGLQEFVIDRTESLAVLEFFEATGDDQFALAHVLDLSSDPAFASYHPADVGDADGDGLSEILVRGRTGNSWYVRLYESLTVDSYPTELAWEVSHWEARCRIADTDNDGKQEIVLGGSFICDRLALCLAQ